MRIVKLGKRENYPRQNSHTSPSYAIVTKKRGVVMCINSNGTRLCYTCRLLNACNA
jgi:hypothetical protein